jgi:O-antigen/teichoic acid export membrane protein
MTALFPALTRMYTSSSDSFAKLAQKSIDLITIVAVPIGLGVMIISNQLVVLLYGSAFANSGPILAIRGVVLILTYLNTILGLLLISMDRQKVWARVIAVATVATLPLDIILIPFFQRTFNNGAMGGAMSFVFTDGGMLIAALYLLPKGILQKSNLWLAARVLFSGLAMVAAAWFFRDAFLAIPIVIGAVTYIGLILLLKVISPEDWAIIGQIRTSILQRLRGRFAGVSPTKG